MNTFASRLEHAFRLQGWPQSSMRYVRWLNKLLANGEIQLEERDFLVQVIYM